MSEPLPASSPDRVPELDGLRGVAILLVLAWHLANPQPGTWFGDAAVRALALSWTGVDLFFVLSGFLLGGILLDHAGSPGWLGIFYLRRACRTLPLYAVLLALFALGTWRAEPPYGPLACWLLGGDDALPLAAYATFTQNFWMVSTGTMGAPAAAPTWSLAVEEQFYLVLPALFLRVPRRWLPGVLLALVGAAMGSRIELFQHHPASGFAAHHLLPSRMDALMLGVLGAWACRTPALDRLFARRPAALSVPLGILTAGMAVLAFRSPAMGSYGMAWGGYTWTALFYLVLVLVARYHPSGFVARAARAGWLGHLGRRSYALYLLHQAVAGGVFGLVYGHPPGPPEPGGPAVTLLALGVLGLVAEVSWRFLEDPFLRLGRSRRWSPGPAGSPQPG